VTVFEKTACVAGCGRMGLPMAKTLAKGCIVWGKYLAELEPDC
jgi:hypothetical protein